MSDETRDESTEPRDQRAQETQEETGTDEAGEGQATPQTQQNQGTQGQPTVAEDGVEHNQHIETPEETADSGSDDEETEGDAGQVEEPDSDE